MTRNRAAGVIVALAALLAIAIVTGVLRLPTADSTYFSASNSIAVTGPASPGERIYIGVAEVEVKAGDKLKFSPRLGTRVALDLVHALVGQTGDAPRSWKPKPEEA